MTLDTYRVEWHDGRTVDVEATQVIKNENVVYFFAPGSNGAAGTLAYAACMSEHTVVSVTLINRGSEEAL